MEAYGAEGAPVTSEVLVKVEKTKSALWWCGAMMGMSTMTVTAATS